jgi:hypothetical protein
MTFWQWFQGNGDKVFVFISTSSLAIMALNTTGQIHIPTTVSMTLLVCSVLASQAHQIFFPNPPNGAQLK